MFYSHICRIAISITKVAQKDFHNYYFYIIWTAGRSFGREYRLFSILLEIDIAISRNTYFIIFTEQEKFKESVKLINVVLIINVKNVNVCFGITVIAYNETYW